MDVACSHRRSCSDFSCVVTGSKLRDVVRHPRSPFHLSLPEAFASSLACAGDLLARTARHEGADNNKGSHIYRSPLKRRRRASRVHSFWIGPLQGPRSGRMRDGVRREIDSRRGIEGSPHVDKKGHTVVRHRLRNIDSPMEHRRALPRSMAGRDFVQPGADYEGLRNTMGESTLITKRSFFLPDGFCW